MCILKLYTHVAKISGWAKKSPYISSRDRLSRMNVGRTTLVRSIPSRTWDSRWEITLPCASQSITVGENPTMKMKHASSHKTSHKFCPVSFLCGMLT